MKRFKNILVIASDDTNACTNLAIKRGAALAEQNNGRLTLMDIVEAPEYAKKEYKRIFNAEEIIGIFVKQRETELENIADELRSKNIEVKVKVVAGRDFIEIIRQVLQEKHDILIKVANHHEDTSFDSSDFHLMRKCPQPVWLVRPDRNDQCRKVLAAVDLKMENDSEGKALNKLVMDLASSLASSHGADLHILSCWSLYGENALRNSGFLKVPEDEFEQILQQEECSNQSRLQEIAANYSSDSNYSHLIKGEPKKCIPDFVNSNDIDVVVMGTVGRSGIPGLLIGNTAETVLQLIDSSVITVKPAGFETPVK